MTPLKCVADHTGERVDQFLARTVPDLPDPPSNGYWRRGR